MRRLIYGDFATVYRNGIDVLLTPTVLTDAPKYSWFSQADNRTRTLEQDVFTQPINMAGLWLQGCTRVKRDMIDMCNTAVSADWHFDCHDFIALDIWHCSVILWHATCLPFYTPTCDPVPRHTAYCAINSEVRLTKNFPPLDLLCSDSVSLCYHAIRTHLKNWLLTVVVTRKIGRVDVNVFV